MTTQQPIAFSELFDAALAGHPRLNPNSDLYNKEAAVSTASYFKSWPALARYGADGLVNDFGWTPESADVLVRIANSQAEEQSNQPDFQITLNGEASAAASANATAGAGTSSPYGTYAHLLAGPVGGSALGISGISTKINPEAIKRASWGVSAFVVAGTGILDVFNADFWRRLQIEDFELRDKIDQWTHKKETEGFLTDDGMEKLFRDIQGLFGPKFDDLMGTVAKMSRRLRVLQNMGPQANFDIGDDADQFADLGELVPLVAEQVSRAMLKSTMPEKSRRVIEMIRELLDILRSEKMRPYVAGAVNGPDEQATRLLEGQLSDDQIVNKLRLALAYERLVAALAECPEMPGNDYLLVVGQLAAHLATMFKVVAPNQEVGADARPFRPAQPTAVAGAQAHAEARVGFSLNLSITWRRS